MKRQPYPQRARVPERTDDVAETIAWLTEGIISIGPYRVGLDPLIGLVPGIGDTITALVSVVIVQRAWALGVPKPAIVRMVANIVIDAVVGAVPFLGDLFDFVFRANTKNLAILRESLRGERRKGRDVLFVLGVVLALAAAVAVPIAVLVLLLRQFAAL